MLKDNLIRLLGNRRNQVILGVLLLLIIIALVLVRSGKKAPLACSPQSCPTGCCVEGACIPKGTTLAGYSCLGNAGAGTGGSGGFLGWSTPQGQTVKNTPQEVVKAIRELPKEELKAIVESGTGGLTSSGPTPTYKPLTNQEASEISSKSMTWFDTMTNDVGRYFMFESCNSGICEKANDVDKQIGINVVWSRYRKYLNSNSPQELTNIEKDLTTLTTPNIGFPAQNDFLNCKLMYEMSQSGVFSEENKDKIDLICTGSVHYGPEMQEFISTLSQNKYQSDPQISEVNSGQVLDKWPIANPDKFLKYGIYASDIATYYLWAKKPDDLAAAKYYFNMALQIFSDRNSDLDDSIIGLAALDLYKASNEQRYLEFADYYLSDKAKRQCRSLQDCTYYLLFLDDFSQLNESSLVRSQRDMTLQTLFTRGYNENKKLFHTFNGLTYPTLENALLSGYLAKYNN